MSDVTQTQDSIQKARVKINESLQNQSKQSSEDMILSLLATLMSTINESHQSILIATRKLQENSNSKENLVNAMEVMINSAPDPIIKKMKQDSDKFSSDSKDKDELSNDITTQGTLFSQVQLRIQGIQQGITFKETDSNMIKQGNSQEIQNVTDKQNDFTNGLSAYSSAVRSISGR